MKKRDPIRKGAGHHTDAHENTPTQAKSSRTVYRRRGVFARQPRLRLVYDRDNLAEKALQEIEEDIRKRPVRLPLSCFRVAEQINLGRLPYTKTWERIEAAAYEGGARPEWVARCIFHGIAAAQISDTPTVKLALLAAEGVQ